MVGVEGRKTAGMRRYVVCKTCEEHGKTPTVMACQNEISQGLVCREPSKLNGLPLKGQFQLHSYIVNRNIIRPKHSTYVSRGECPCLFSLSVYLP